MSLLENDKYLESRINFLRRDVELLKTTAGNEAVLTGIQHLTQNNIEEILAAPLLSTIQYVITEVITLTGLSINFEIPTEGLHVRGYSRDLSRIICADNTYTLFTSAGGAAGGLTLNDMRIEITGTTSKVFNIKDASGLSGIEVNNVTYANCTSLGTLDGFGAGVEEKILRLAGTPDLTFAGNWVSGYSMGGLVFGIDNTMAVPLFRAGTAFVMNSRFRTDINCDLGTLAAFSDFAPANFATSDLFVIHEAFISRNGVFDPTDTSIMTHILASDLESHWSGNLGIDNTYKGGVLSINAEVTTNVIVQNDWYDLAGLYVASALQHFDHPSNGQLRYLGKARQDFNIGGQLVLEGQQNSELEIRTTVWRDDPGVFEFGKVFHRVVNNLQGGRNVAYLVLQDSLALGVNDYAKIQVRNTTGTQDITAELSSFVNVFER